MNTTATNERSTMYDPANTVVLKVSGEMLSKFGNESERPYFQKAIDFLADAIASANGVHRALIIGGGNIARGEELQKNIGMEAAASDAKGMDASTENAKVLSQALARRGCDTVIVTPSDIVARNGYQTIRSYAKDGKTIILAGGTGWPGFTTDTSMMSLAKVLGCPLALKGTKVDGIFSKPPEQEGAEMFTTITEKKFLELGLDTILDRTAVTYAKRNNISIRVFNALKPGNIAAAIKGEPIGTLLIG